MRRRVLDRLYRTERHAVLTYLASKVGSDAALDMAQDVFIKAAASSQLLHLRNPAAFLRRIAGNLVIDAHRRQACSIPAIASAVQSEPVVQADQDAILCARESEHLLARCIASLPAKTGLIFRMHRFEKLTYRQIHLALGIALPTVDYHMIKALNQLRRELCGDDDSEIGRTRKNNYS